MFLTDFILIELVSFKYTLYKNAWVSKQSQKYIKIYINVKFLAKAYSIPKNQFYFNLKKNLNMLA